MKKNSDQSKISEVIIGLIGGVGVDFDKVIEIIKVEFRKYECECDLIHLTEIIKEGKRKDVIEGIEKKMDHCSKLRKKYGNNYLSLLAVREIILKRSEKLKGNKTVYRNVFIIRSIKRKEELCTLKEIYGDNFISLSIFRSKEKRKKYLEESFMIKNGNEKAIKDKIENLIKKDEKETDMSIRDNGQDIRGVYSLSDYFINYKDDNILEKEVERLAKIIFCDPFCTPTKEELAMFSAYGMALKSSDLSRQVGAVIVNEDDDIVAMGTNEVPKFGGGYYWERDSFDARDFKKGFNINDKKKYEICQNIITSLCEQSNKSTKTIKKRDIERCAMVSDLLEYGRSVHAEEAAICDAARRGVSINGLTMYCTTFSCHLCAKHLLSVGLKKVVYIEPFPKSQAADLFPESICVEGEDSEIEKLKFEPYSGVSLRLYINAFRMDELNGKEREIEKTKNIKIAIVWRPDGGKQSFAEKNELISFLYYKKEKYYIDALKNKSKLSFINKAIKEIESFIKKKLKNR